MLFKLLVSIVGCDKEFVNTCTLEFLISVEVISEINKLVGPNKGM